MFLPSEQTVNKDTVLSSDGQETSTILHTTQRIEISDTRSSSVSGMPKFEIWDSLAVSLSANKRAYSGTLGTTGYVRKSGHENSEKQMKTFFQVSFRGLKDRK